jgi:hypothetical protein
VSNATITLRSAARNSCTPVCPLKESAMELIVSVVAQARGRFEVPHGPLRLNPPNHVCDKAAVEAEFEIHFRSGAKSGSRVLKSRRRAGLPRFLRGRRPIQAHPDACAMIPPLWRK